MVVQKGLSILILAAVLLSCFVAYTVFASNE